MKFEPSFHLFFFKSSKFHSLLNETSAMCIKKRECNQGQGKFSNKPLVPLKIQKEKNCRVSPKDFPRKWPSFHLSVNADKSTASLKFSDQRFVRESPYPHLPLVLWKLPCFQIPEGILLPPLKAEELVKA